MIRWKRKAADPVSVNARLARLSREEMLIFVETSIMQAGYHLRQYRVARGDHLAEVRQQLRWALEGADELGRRDEFPV